MNYSNIGAKCIIKTKFLPLVIGLLIVVILGGLALATPAHSQSVKSLDKVLKDTLIKSVSYKIYVGSRGGRYVLKTSVIGVVYKMYIKSK